MKIAITTKFQNSYFSGSLPQVCLFLGTALKNLNHTVHLLVQNNSEQKWFIDCLEHQKNVPDVISFDESKLSSAPEYDLLIEVIWFMNPENRLKFAKQSVLFLHFPPFFHDLESSIYNFNGTKRNFTNLNAIWTWDCASEDDIKYIEFLSGVQVSKIPILYDPTAIDVYLKETSTPSWNDSAKDVESKIPKDAPKSIDWCARVLESNASNSSSAVLPLNIIANIRNTGNEIRWMVHNSDSIKQSDFLKDNVLKNINLGSDISGNLVGRLRFPDYVRDKTVIVSHLRWRPFKYYLFDALYLDVPTIHNSQIARNAGSPYYYELNQISDGVKCFLQIQSDYESKSGFFSPKASELRKTILKQKYSPSSDSILSEIQKAIQKLDSAKVREPLKPLQSITHQISNTTTSSTTNEIRIAFLDMWENFQSNHNFFLFLLAFAGSKHKFNVIVDEKNPNVIIYGPFGTKHQEHQFKQVPKIFYTGENLPPRKEHNTLLNLGFNYPEANGLPYIRLPLWILEINWFNQDVNKFVNPLPVSLEDAMKIHKAEKRSKFCAFVASNPSNQLRNGAFQIIHNKYKPIESAGRLFTNRPDGILPSGAGGGGGELIKVDYYKQFKFVLAFENSSAHGYTTEKIFHAKVAGAIPIYWGDPLVERDFDKNGFFNAGNCTTPDDLVSKIKALDENEELCMKMMSIPALSNEKKKQCEMIMSVFVKAVGAIVLKREINLTDDDWKSAQSFLYESNPIEEISHEKHPLVQTSQTSQTIPIETKTETKHENKEIIKTKPEHKRVFISATNKKFLPNLLMLFDSLQNLNEQENQFIDEKIAYVWNDVSEDDVKKIVSKGVSVVNFPEDSYKPYEDYWNVQHFAWKLFIFQHQLKSQPKDTNILYFDAGVFIANSLNPLYEIIEKNDILLFNDDEQINERWCHPTFCEFMKTTNDELKANQIWAGSIGFKQFGKYASLFNEAFTISSEHREVIVGNKWKPYSSVCSGHRHDQSILSILTERAKAPRVPLKDYYCDHSLTRTLNYSCPLYVHRGNFKKYVNILPGIGEAYLVNLDRRPDRLKQFKENHHWLSKNTYKWRAVDGKNIQLTEQITHLFRDNDFKWKKSVMGCALSHLQLWEKCANDPNKVNYLIMEDDVKFNKDWEKLWLQMAPSMPKDADFIYLGGVLPPNKPALPRITEKINEYFAKVAKNNLFGSISRRYFHFCNYSYIITPQGAQKMMNLIMQKGIFTSVDHMICNHGDSIFNIYFTTPLLAGCFQDEDPVYQTSQFNDFNRVDKFDSDIWNNNDHFSPEEVSLSMSQLIQKTMKVSIDDTKVEEVTQDKKELSKDSTIPSLIITDSDSINESTRESTSESTSTILPISQKPIYDQTKVNNDYNELIKFMSLSDKENTVKQISNIISYIQMFDSGVINEQIMQFTSILYQIVKFKKSEEFIQSIQTNFAQYFETIQSLITKSSNPKFLKMKFNDLFEKPKEIKEEIKEFNVAEELKTLTLHFFPDTSLTCEKSWLEDLFERFFIQKQIGDFSLVQNNDFVLYQHTSKGIQSHYYKALFDYLVANNKQVYLLHISDEFGNDNIDLYEHKAIKHIFRNYYRNDIKQSNVMIIPLGYNTKVKYGTESKLFEKKEYCWSFAGAIDRPGRKENLKLLENFKPNFVQTKETFGSESKVVGEKYIEMLNNSKFVPCFKGFCSLESFRLYEALEAGSIPVYVPSESRNGIDNEYTRVLGKNPLLAIPNWNSACMILEKVCGSPDIMEKHRQDLISWWKQKKSDLKKQIKKIIF